MFNRTLSINYIATQLKPYKIERVGIHLKIVLLPSLVIIGFSDRWWVPQSSKLLKPSIETILLSDAERLLSSASLEKTGKDGDDLVMRRVAQQDDRENFSKSFENEPRHVFCCATSVSGSAVIVVAKI